jgi:transposase
MLDLTPDPEGRPRARLLDLVAGRSGKAHRDWLDARGQVFVATV